MTDIPIRQAIVLAAGRGSRMGAACEQLPKALLPLGGRRLIEWNLGALAANGIQRVLLIGGWQAERLAAEIATLEAGLGLEIELRCNLDWARTGVVRSLQCADDWLRGAPSLLVYADCAYAPRSIATALAGHAGGLRVPGDVRWAALWSLRFEHPLADAERWRNEGPRLLQIGGRAQSLAAERAQFMGLVVVDPPAWTQVQEHIGRWQQADGAAGIDRLDMTGLLSRLLDADLAIECVDIDGGWVEVDCEQDLQRIGMALGAPDFAHDFRR
jgi:choline kinase